MLLHRLRQWQVWLGGALLACLTAGCGTAEYERRVDAHIAELRSGSAFNVLSAPATLPGSNVQIRVPVAFTKALRENASIDGKPIDPRRAKVPLLTMPSDFVAYEATVADAAKGKLPYYLYAKAMPAKDFAVLMTDIYQRSRGNDEPRPLDRVDASGRLARDLRSASEASASAVWTDVTFPTPDGGKVAWQMMRIDAPMEFYYVGATGDESFVSMPGRLVCYARVFGDQLVLLVWRWPTSMEAHADEARLGPLVAGSVTAR